MVESMLLAVLIITISIALMSVKVIFKKNGRFASQHIHDSEALKAQGIHCVLDQDREARRDNKAY